MSEERAVGVGGDAGAAGAWKDGDGDVAEGYAPRAEVDGGFCVEGGGAPYARFAARFRIGQGLEVGQRQQNLQVGCIRVGVHAAPKRLSRCVVR